MNRLFFQLFTAKGRCGIWRTGSLTMRFHSLIAHGDTLREIIILDHDRDQST